ncbi:hypothetical protein NST83_06805 [Paenibacillus sp. FSL R10-2782]|uniref:hypothetical protein n=1 Tax=Paenibacillus sp. FSL R10-2782 TaxID=2954661 RepID=UPI003158ECF7
MGNIEVDVLVELQAFIQTLRQSSNVEKQGLVLRFGCLEEHKHTLSTILNCRTRSEVNQQKPDQLSADESQSLQHDMNGKTKPPTFPMNEYMRKVQRDQSRKMLNAEIADIRTGSMEYICMRKHQTQDLQGVLRHQRTFHMPEGVTELTRNEYLTRANMHPSYTINSGDVIVHMTLPKVTNDVSPTQLEAIGNGLGRGLKNGRAGSLRDQLLMNPTTAYRSSTSY